MSVQAVRNEIRLATADHLLTEAEAKNIVKAAKHNIRPDEVALMASLFDRIRVGEVDIEPGAGTTIADASVPGAHETSFGKAYGETIAAPWNLAWHLSDELISASIRSGNGALFVMALLATFLLMVLGATFMAALAPVTATVVGLPRAAIVSTQD